MTVLSAVQSLVQAVLAALGPSQNQRLLRLHTPLGPNVLLAERMHGTETISPRASGASAAAGFKFEVLALSTNAHLQLKDLIGQPVRLDLLTQQSATVLRPFHGYVTAFALLGSDGGLARYKLTIEPWLSFLGKRQDAWVFQDKTVMQIVDEVFADYQGQGKLAPAWRWELADASVYPQRSLCMQYHESDLAFVQRLLAEEGLFFWFEHSAAEGDTLGQHTLVIADHNGCFRPNVQPRVRYTQSAAASFKEDSLTRFQETRRIAPTALATASWDHAAVQQAGAQAAGDARLNPTDIQLSLRDQPGAYAYVLRQAQDDRGIDDAQRITQRRLEATQAPAYQYQAQGALRQAACATTFSLSEHASVNPATRWVTLAVQHRGRNNITADLGTSLQGLLGKLPQAFAPQGEQASEGVSARAPKPSLFKGSANHTDEPLYQAQLITQDASIPVRASACHGGERGDIGFTRPQVNGAQTAIVVGLGEPVHTDRDGRIKIQFHWQRGAHSAHRLSHPAGSNAPGDDSAGTWVRVSQAWAGANWGGHHTPRLGQEVLVSFIEGDIDRPVVTGSVYNGQGQPDAQGNQVAAGAATATGNAGGWFPGNLKAGELEGHQHPQVLAGFKSQSLEASQSGTGGYNQFVLDDSPSQARVTLGSTSANTWLQLGHLIQQNDNQRLAKRGHGFDLATGAHGAVRAGAGLHLSAYTRAQGTQSSAQVVEARPGIAQIEQAGELMQTLSETAQKHNAKLGGEKVASDLPARRALLASVGSLSETDTFSAEPTEGIGDQDSAPVEQRQGEDQAFDEQILFVNAQGDALREVKYVLFLEDGQQRAGMTDSAGKTERVATPKPLKIVRAELTGVTNPNAPSCCARHEEAAMPETLKVSLLGVITNEKDVGKSVKKVQTPEGGSRAMTEGEIAMARTLFGSAVNFALAKVHNRSFFWLNMQKKGTAVTPNGEIYFRAEDFNEDFSLAEYSEQLWFMHEMVHVWQYQLGYPVKAVGLMSWATSYKYTLSADKKLGDYNMEQQGNILSDYWALKNFGSPPSLWEPKHRQDLVLYEKVLKGFIENPTDAANLPDEGKPSDSLGTEYGQYQL